MTWRKDSEMKFGISMNFDESNNKVEVAGISDESVGGEKNRRLSEIPAACSYALQPGDIIEAVNLQTDIEEIQRELQTALSIQMKVARMKNFSVPDTQTAKDSQWNFQPMKRYDGQESQGEYLFWK